MIDNSHAPGKSDIPRKFFSRRRLALMASVGAFAILSLAAGTGSYREFGLGSWNSSAQAAEVAAPSRGFADLVERVKPAVVSVRIQKDEPENAVSTNENGEDGASPAPQGYPSEKFFQQFGGGDSREGNLPAAPQRHQMITGEGSGFFISADGYAVTNYHVVDHAKSVQVTTDDGTVYKAKVVGIDPKTDLALIKVNAAKALTFVKFADRAPRIGDWVVAVGNPFGLGGTVTAGIVSASGRDIGAGPYDYIQIDAPINKGNSGGPAFDTDGNVIGVNTAIYSPSGGSVGIGFDVSAETAKAVVAQLKDKGYVTHGLLGVQVQPVTAEIADSLGMKNAEGAIVDAPQAGSPAAKAGIQAGDVITAINGTPLKDSRELARKIGMMSPGTSVNLDLLRNGQTTTAKLSLGGMPNERQASADPDQARSASGVPHLGLSIAPESEAGNAEAGVVVAGVDPNGIAADHGLKAGDVIIGIGGKHVANAEDIRSALIDAKAQGRHEVLIRVKTADATRFVAVPLSNG